jgi:hypothetical protein
VHAPLLLLLLLLLFDDTGDDAGGISTQHFSAAVAHTLADVNVPRFGTAKHASGVIHSPEYNVPTRHGAPPSTPLPSNASNVQTAKDIFSLSLCVNTATRQRRPLREMCNSDASIRCIFSHLIQIYLLFLSTMQSPRHPTKNVPRKKKKKTTKLCRSPRSQSNSHHITASHTAKAQE